MSEWVKNAADEKAVAAGCRFDEDAAAHVCDFFERELRLYEGTPGAPFVLMPWQRELLSRAFGWVIWSDDWGRWVRRFNVVSAFLPKKSGKTPLAAGVGLYLLAADGEHGQKVYSSARDGKQARLVHDHAVRMARHAPRLAPFCKFNQTTGAIFYEPTMSSYSILSGDNCESAEGLNGSLIADELHVCPYRLMRVLEYMGASRSEPMRFQISTAGNNPEGFGKKQFDYGQQVNRGDLTDHHYLHVFYGVPEHATDEECSDPATWERVNPSWRVTIKPAEFRASFERAKSQGVRAWSEFCQYRLNKWQSSGNPWLRQDDWEACGSKFKLPDMAGYPAWLSLDLSKTRDMSALCVTVAHDDDSETVSQLCRHWITESYAQNNAEVASWQDWAVNGWLTIIPGDYIKQGVIRREVVDIIEALDVRGLVYDKTYAQEFVDWLQDEYPSVECVEFPQSAAHMTRPIDDFEAAVIGRKLRHDGNACLSWQVGHCETFENFAGHRRLIKPKRGDVRKIDGLVASVMGLWGVQLEPQTPKFDFYETHDLELI